MNRRLCACLLAVGAATLCGCDQTVTQSAVSLPGPNSVAVAGRSLFIASTAGDELRALDLSQDPRAFVRAPNPLFPLSMPTAPLPRAVAAYTAVDGTTAPFAFALSTAGGQVNVVSTTTLATLGTVVVPDVSLAIAVTKPAEGEDERLVVAVTQGENGSLWAARFPASMQQDPTAIAAVQPSLAVLLGASSPQVLAASPSDPDWVAVGDRLTGPDGLGRTGGLALCNLRTGTVVRLDVGGPVSALSFDLVGGRLFGLLDAEACGSQSPCNGFFGVDVADPTSPKLLNLVDVPSTARGLAVGGAIVVTLPSGATKTVDPLIVVTATDGSLYSYDGAAVDAVDSGEGLPPGVLAFRRYDTDADGNVTAVDDPTNGPKVHDADGNTIVALTRGVVRTEALSLTWEGALARGGAGKASPGALEDPAFDFGAMGVVPGDVLLVNAASQGTCEKDAEGEVKATVIQAKGSSVSLAGLDCLGTATIGYAVRALKQYVVIGSRSGYLGRALPGGTFSGAGATFDLGPLDETIVRDTRFTLSLGAGIVPYSLPLGASVMLPGAVAYDPVNQLFYAAYPGGNAVVELKPTEMRSASSDLGVVAYH